MCHAVECISSVSGAKSRDAEIYRIPRSSIIKVDPDGDRLPTYRTSHGAAAYVRHAPE